MVSQVPGQQHSPVDPCDGISYDSENTHGSPRLLDTDHCPCQLDIRLTRHKAAWVTPLCVQQPQQDFYLQKLTRQNSEDHLVVDAPYPWGSSSSSLGASLAETLLSEDTADSMRSISAQGSGKRNNDFSLAKEEQEVPLGHSQQVSLLRSPKVMSTSPASEVASACFKSPRGAVCADEGVGQVSRRSQSLNSFSSETFVLPVDVEKENAHFHAADMMIAAMEAVKWHLLSQQQPGNWSMEEASGSPQSHQANSEGSFRAHVKHEPGSFTSSDSCYGGCTVLQVRSMAETPASNVIKEACKCDWDEFVILDSEELNYITEICRNSCNSKSIICTPDFTSAQLLARELFQVFRKCWMLSEANHQLPVSLSTASSVVSEGYVQEDFDPSVNVIQEVTLTPWIRGTEDWAPPGFQIILHVHPPLKRDMVVVAQNFLCAGCGTAIEPKFVKRLRYCEYLGKYFCDCCHSYAESYIPARILTSWDFRKYYVSNFSKWLLDSIWHQPVFSLLSHNSLYAKAKELDRVKDIQEQLFHIKKMLKTCRFADSALKDFEQIPSHLTDELHLFSLEDFVRTKRGLLAPLLKDILNASLVHVASCELCQGKGFICEFCQSTTVIFPFQTTTCRRCSACKACFHKQCFQSSGCPRCARIKARRSLLESLPSAAT